MEPTKKQKIITFYKCQTKLLVNEMNIVVNTD